jgi:acyl transferase domain-containing protein
MLDPNSINSPIAVVGIAAIMPQAPDAATFWANIRQGRYCITEVPPERWDPALYYSPDPSAPDKTYSKIGGWVREFPWDPMRWKLPVPPKVAEQLDEGQRWAISAARAALMDAGWPNWKVDSDNVAVILGNAIGGEKHYRSSMRIELPEVLQGLANAPSLQPLPAAQREAIVAETRAAFLARTTEINEDTMPGELSNVIAGRVANLFNLRGPNFTCDAACASGLAAMSAAIEGLIDHRFDAVVTGGVDRNMSVAGFVKFCKIGALSATGTRPFDAGADGFVMGEGAALFVLKRLEDAERDGDRIYAVILGIAGSSDGKGKGITAPNPIGQKLAVQRAWELAGVDPATATAIEAHGTSTRVGDATELESLTSVFSPAGAPRHGIALGSVKSNIGHLKAAAGTAGLFKMVMSLHEKVLAPSLNFNVPNPNVDWDTSPFVVNTRLRDWPAPPCGVRRAGVSAFGFGGTNFHVVLEEYIPGRYKARPRAFAAGQMAAESGAAAGAAALGGAAPGSAAVGAAPGAAVASGAPGGVSGGGALGGAGGSASGASAPAPKPPLRGALVLGGASDADLVARLERALADARAGRAPAPAAPDPSIGAAPVRAAVDFADAADLASKLEKLIAAFKANNAAMFRLLRQQGAFVGRGPAPKVAFLYTGQGSQYVNMLAELRAREPIVAETFRQADTVMTPLLGRPLTSYIFIDGNDPAAVARLENELRQTEITQPALLATDASLHRLLAAYGIGPDMVMGHSLGEYGALTAAGSLTFEAALEAVSSRGREMAHLKVEDNGAMAAVTGPLDEIQKIVEKTPGYVVVANINSNKQAVIGGATAAVNAAIEAFAAAGMQAARIPVSHAFHTSIVAPAAVPLVATLRRLNVRPPRLPIVANVTGEFYPADATTETMLEFLGRQVASPVQFVKGLKTLYDAGARVFVEVGPKRALHGFVEDVLGHQADVLALFTNHPKQGDIAAFNQALCGLWAAGLGFAQPSAAEAVAAEVASAAVARAAAPSAALAAPTGARAATAAPGAALAAPSTAVPSAPAPSAGAPAAAVAGAFAAGASAASAAAPAAAMAAVAPGLPAAGAAPSGLTADDRIVQLGRLFAGVLEQVLRLYGVEPGAAPATPLAAPVAKSAEAAADAAEPVVITGAALGLPGVERVFDDGNIARILAGQQMIGSVPEAVRRRMADMHITRLVKNEIGGATFEEIDDPAEVVKLAGRHAPFDVVQEFAVDTARDEALDATTRLAIGAGFDALRDAGIPLVMRYKTTTLGTQLPDRWGLPDQLRDDTGVIFASAFPGYDNFAAEVEGYVADRARREQLLALEAVRAKMSGTEPAYAEVERLIAKLREELQSRPYRFDRRFLFRVLSMGHAQFAEIIGARGPNTQINAACASTTQALSLAEDWIRAGRCRRVVVVSADDVTNETMLPWIASGFLASGAAATDEKVEDAATPFDRRRHGMIVGMGAAAFVVESAEAARERGLAPICEVLGAVIANSAFHGTRLDVEHIGAAMEAVVREAEARGIDRAAIAGETVFVSHETYTPARGGSASAEIHALRRVFGPAADRIVITNTKGFTGHAMGAGIEDVVAIKSLETGLVPPVPNFREPDPELGVLNLSRGGAYPVRYALRLAAGFGSQIAMALLRWTPPPDGQRRAPRELGFAYRVADAAAWQRWLDSLAGRAGAQLEIDHRRLRIVDRGAPAVAGHTSEVRVPYAGRLKPLPAVAPVAAGAAPAVAAPALTVAAVPAPAVTATAVAAPAAAVSVAAAPTVAPSVAPAAAPAGAPAAALSPGAGSAPAAASDPVLEEVTAIVSKMTGYPADLLDPDLDLEADLGVDTVKQAEVFAAVRGHYGVERDPNLRLRDFPTLRHVAAWVRQKAGLGEVSAASAASATTATGAAPAASAALATAATPPAQAVAGAPAASASVALAPAAATAPAAPATPAAATDPVLSQVTAIVAQMTGYPAELLDPDLDLEADLGVDTVKQAEVFAAVRGHYGVERDPNLKLRDFPTLRHVAAWVRQRAGLGKAPAASAAPATAAPTAAPAIAGAPTTATASAAATTATASAPAVSAAPAVAADPVLAQVTAIVAQMTGYPAELLDPDLDLEADLGVDTVKQAEVFAAVRGHYGVERDPNLKLRDFPTLRHVAAWVRQRAGLGEAPAASAVAATGATGATTPAPGATPAAASAPAVQPPAPVSSPALAAEASAEATAPPAAPAAGGAPSEDEVLAQVTKIVAEMTGYPPDLLGPDLDLEADLGVDTVKQAEVFAAVRGHYGVERDPNLKLRDFPTLRHVAGWVRERAGLAAAAPAVKTAAEAAPVARPEAPPVVRGDLTAVDALPRRIPVPSLRPAASRCLPTSVQLREARVVVMGDEGGVAKALAKQLAKAGATVLSLPAGIATDALASQLAQWRQDGPIAGVYWLPALDDEGDLAALDLPAWQEALRRRVKNLYAAMRQLYESSPFLVAATRMGGLHGFDAAGATQPLGGAVTGFAKSYRKERPQALVKAVDFAAGVKPAAIAEQLVEETLADPGCVEIGRVGDDRFGIAFVEAPFPPLVDGQPAGASLTLGKDSVFLVTGAAGSIVSAITADLAAASGGTFHLLDLTPAPDRNDPDLAAFRSDREGLKATLAARIKAAGGKATPVAIERELARIERLNAALTAVQAVEAAGGTAHYYAVDLTDAEAVAHAIARVRETSGRIDVLLHAAGLEISRNLPEKEPREFDLVFGVKSDGWFNVMKAAEGMPIGATVAFSSVAGRFGNQGQTDYAAANDLLCKIASHMRRTRPDTRALAVDWTAWGGIGMATRGSIPKIMEMAGVQMLPPEAGVAWIRRELLSSDYRGEVIVAGQLGMMAAELHPSGGVDPAALAADRAGPMVGSATLSVHDGIVVRTVLDPKVQPFLNDHRIDGIPVLPGVMGMEAFAEAARLLAPDYQVVAVEDVDFAAPLKFFRDEPREIVVQAVVAPAGDELLARCRLIAERMLPGQDKPSRTVHFTGTVRLARARPKAEKAKPVGPGNGARLDAGQVYAFYFHGPAYRVVASAWRDEDQAAARLAEPLPDNHQPPKLPLATAPRLVELCFQTAGLWQAGTEGQLALPLHVGGARVLRDPAKAKGTLVATARQVAPGRFDCRVVDAEGNVIVRLDDYRSIPLPAPIPEAVAGSLRAAFQG